MSKTMSLPVEEITDGWQLTGRHVLAMLVIFFGIIITVSIVFTTLAVKSFRGEDIKQSYRQGIEYNSTLEARAAQSQLGWTATVNVVGNMAERSLVVKVTDQAEAGLQGVTFSGGLRHPVDSTLDRPVIFETFEDGTARANLTGLLGQWTLEADAIRGEDRFHFRRDLDLR